VRLIDTHCHLQADRFDPDRDDVLAAAREAGVERVLIPGWDLDSSLAAVAFAQRVGADAGAGIHPHASADEGGTWPTIAALAKERSVVAVGETGLDYDRAFAPRETQLANLRRHLALALELGKPVILHCRSRDGERDAQDDLLRELEAAGFGSARASATFGERPRGVLHSYSGPVDYAERALDLGLAISISGLAFRTSERATSQVVPLVAPDRLLVETDAPWLSPPGAPRRRNEPRYVDITARWVAKRRGEDPETLGQQLVASYDATFPRSS
jgi:TatD DNase family protein